MPQEKTLSPKRIKQLENNANLMLQNGYSDNEIQEMSKQFIEQYGEKKNEVSGNTSDVSENGSSPSQDIPNNKKPMQSVVDGLGDVVETLKQQKQAPQPQPKKDIYTPLRSPTTQLIAEGYQDIPTQLESLDTKSKIDVINNNLQKIKTEKSVLNADINSVYGTTEEKNKKRDRIKQLEDAQQFLIGKIDEDLSKKINEFSTIPNTNIVQESKEDVANILLSDGLDYLKYANNGYYSQLNSIIESGNKLSDNNKKRVIDIGLSAGLDSLNKQEEELIKQYENDGRPEYQDLYQQGLNGIYAQRKALVEKYNEYISNDLPEYKQTQDRIKELDKKFEDSPVWESIKQGIFNTAGNTVMDFVKGVASYEVNILSKLGIIDKGDADALMQDNFADTFEVSKELKPEVLRKNPNTGETEFVLSGVLPTMVHTTVQSIGLALSGGGTSLGMILSSAVLLSGQMQQQLIEEGMDEQDAYWVGMILGGAEGLIESMYIPELNILKGTKLFKGKLPKETAKIYDDIIRNGGGDIKTRTKDFIKAVGEAAQVTKGEIKEELLSDVADRLVKSIYNTNNDILKQDVEVTPYTLEEAFNTAVTTTVGMLPMAFLGGVKNYTGQQASSIYLAGLDPTKYIKHAQDMLDQNIITLDQYNNATQNIGYMVKAINATPNIDIEGNKLTDDQKFNYALKQFKKIRATEQKKMLEDNDEMNVVYENNLNVEINNAKTELDEILAPQPIENKVLYTTADNNKITYKDIDALSKDKDISKDVIKEEYGIGDIAAQSIFEKYNNLKPKQNAVQKQSTAGEVLQPKSTGESKELGLPRVEQKDESKVAPQEVEKEVEGVAKNVEVSPYSLSEQELTELTPEQLTEYTDLKELYDEKDFRTPKVESELESLVSNIRSQKQLQNERKEEGQKERVLTPQPTSKKVEMPEPVSSASKPESSQQQGSVDKKAEPKTETEDWRRDVESTAKALDIADFTINTPIKGLSVRMSDLKIAEENLSKGKTSVTPDAAVDVTINLTTGERELSDGYHRYLEARGGAIESAKTTNLEGTIPAKIKFEVNEKSGGFIKSREASKQEVSEAYHKAKADGTNPELVKAVEEILNKNNDQEKSKRLSRIQHLVSNEKSLSKSEQQELQILRGQRDNYTRILDNGLLSISERYGGETNPESYNRQDRQQYELLQRELQMVNKSRTSDEQNKYNNSGLYGKQKNSEGIGDRNEGEVEDTLDKNISSKDKSRTSSSEANIKQKGKDNGVQQNEKKEELLGKPKETISNTEGETQTTEAQLQEFGVPEQDVKPVTNVLTAMVDGLRKAGLTAAKTVGEFVGIGRTKQQDIETKDAIAEITQTIEVPKLQPVKVKEEVIETKTEQVSPTVNKITDVGEKIGGARKDLAEKLGSVTSEDIKSQPLSKVFPKPDFDKLISEKGISKDVAILLNYLYSKIPSKPRKSYQVSRWVDKVNEVIDIYRNILEEEGGSRFAERVIDGLRKSSTFQRDYNIYSAIINQLGFRFNPGTLEIKEFSRVGDGKKTFTIVNGRYIVKDYDTLEEAVNGLGQIVDAKKDKPKETKFDIYQDTKTKEYFVGKKGATGVNRIAEGFKTLKEARDFLKTNQEQLQETWDALRDIPTERRKENRDRKGIDWRKGKNVDAEEFRNTFGFRGVEFGNWVNQNERQQSINEAYDALMDLASVLKLSPKSISLGGELGFAFGARGSGKHNAHYEPDKIVINLTKTKGAGSVAHEWWHGIDNYFSRKRGVKTGYVTESPTQRLKTDYVSGLGRVVVGKDESIRPEMIDAFKGVVDAIRNSKLPERSKDLDKGRSNVYWSTPVEMTARAFENFVIEKLAQTGYVNDYLANLKSVDEWIKDSKGAIDATKNYPYPLADETHSINEAYQNFFDTIQEREEGGRSILFQQEKQQEVKLPNGQTGRVVMADVVDGFYSNTENALSQIKQEKGTGNWWKGQLLSRGAKADEMKWATLDTFLEENKDKSVTKEQIAQYLKDNRVQIVEVVKGGSVSEDEIDTFLNDEAGDGYTREEAREYLSNDENNSQTKFSQYQLEGEKENYKEVLITLPSRNDNLSEKEYEEFRKIDDKVYYDRTPDEQRKYVEYQNRFTKSREANKDFKSSHFDEPNILVHLRMNTRTDSEGNKVLFLEEVQSDWGQEGKKEGFKGFDKNKSLVEPRFDGKYWYLYEKETGEQTSSQSFDSESTAWRLLESNANLMSTGIASAPFVTDTNAWVKLGLKTALKEAVAQGVDRVAWTTGEQQNDRYDLSNSVDDIYTSKYGEEWVDSKYEKRKEVEITLKGGEVKKLVVDENGKVVRGDFAGERLDNIVGKDISEKLLSINEDTNLSGDGLKIGGKGMIGFYGEPSEGKEGIVGKVAKALVKELTGKPAEIVETNIKLGDKLASGYDVTIKDENGRVTTHNFDTKSQGLAWLSKQKNIEVISEKAEGIETSTQHSIEITPELAAEVQAGMPLFQQANAQYRVAAGQRLIEALKDFSKAKNKRQATTAIIHEIMHPTVETIITGAKEGNVVGQKHTKTIVEEYNKANPDNKVTEEELIADNDKFVNGETTDKYRAVQEFIAEQWERYHQEGAKGFSKAFQEVLDAITEAFKSVYQSLTGKQLTPELRQMFDEILGKDAEPQTEKKQKKEQLKQQVSEAAQKLKDILDPLGTSKDPSIKKSGFTTDDLIDMMEQLINKLRDAGYEIDAAVQEALKRIKKNKLYDKVLTREGIPDAEFERKVKDVFISKETDKSSSTEKIHKVIKRFVLQSPTLTAEQREQLLKDNDSYYTVLTTPEIQRIANAIIDEVGYEEAKRIVLEGDTKISQPIRGMIAGELISRLQEKYKDATPKEREALSDVEVAIGDLLQKLSNEATLAGQFIYHIRTIYSLSGIAIAKKVQRMVDEVNKANEKDMERALSELKKLLGDKESAIKSAVKQLEDEQRETIETLKQEAQRLEKELAELKAKADGRDTTERKGKGGNPIKLGYKRKTNKADIEKKIKKLLGKTRLGFGDLDDLGQVLYYYIENAIEALGTARYGDVVNSLPKKLQKNKEAITEAYIKAKDAAIEEGISEGLLSTEEDITDYLQAEKQQNIAQQIIKKQAQLQRVKNKIAQANNPTKARKQSPIEAAKKVVDNAKELLGLKNINTEATYLQKLINQLYNKASEAYKEKNKKEPKSIYDAVAFALENATSRNDMWDSLIDKIYSDIDADDNLDMTQKDEIKNLIETYIKTTIDTLLTEKQQNKALMQMLKDNYGKETNGGNIVVDWDTILLDAKTIQEVERKIDEVIDSLGQQSDEAEQLKENIKNKFRAIYNEKIEDRVQTFLKEKTKGKVSRVFTGLSRNARKIVSLEEKGILNDDRIKQVLGETLGIKNLTSEDIEYIRQLVDRINKKGDVRFYKEKLEEELQYFIRKKTGNTMWGYINDSVAVGQYGSLTNFFQNMWSIAEQLPMLVQQMIALRNPKLSLQILSKAYSEAIQISKTISMTGDVSRGTAYSDIIESKEGIPRVRTLEYFTPAEMKVRVFGKDKEMNPAHIAKNISKYIQRIFEAVDAITSTTVANMASSIYIKEQLIASGLTNAQANQKIREMYLENDFEADKIESERILKSQGLTSPTQAQIKRGAYEIAERRRQEADENKSMAKVAEEMAQILTGKGSKFGLFMIPYIMMNAVTQKIKGVREQGDSAKALTKIQENMMGLSSLAIDRVLFPFFRAVSNFMELGAEWTMYGVAKSVLYAGKGMMYNKKFSPAESAENKMYATNLLLKGIMGTALAYTILGLLSGGDDDDDETVINAPDYKSKNYGKQILMQKVAPPKTLQYNGVTIPLDMFGSLGMGIYMQQAIRNAAADAWDKAFSQYGIKKVNKKGQSDYDARLDMFNSPEYKSLSAENKKQLKTNLSKMLLSETTLQMIAMTWDLYDSYNRKLGGFVLSDANKISSVLGRPISSMIPANALQKEIAQMFESEEKETEGLAKFANNFSVMQLLDNSRPALDWRGRTYKQHEMYPSSIIGLINMFNKGTVDELDKELVKAEKRLKREPQYTTELDENNLTINGMPLNTQQYKDYEYFKREEMFNLLDRDGMKYNLIEFLKYDEMGRFEKAFNSIKKKAKKSALARVENKYINN